MRTRLQQIRWQKDISTAQLSIKSGVSKSEITKIENGYVATVLLDTAYRLAKALDVEIFYLFIME